MRAFLAAAAAVAVLVPAAHAQSANDDPYLWLEEVDAPRALQWVETQNRKSAARLEQDPR